MDREKRKDQIDQFIFFLSVDKLRNPILLGTRYLSQL